MTNKTVLYRHYDKDGILLYVGISLSAIQRDIQHRSTSNWFNDVAVTERETFNTRREALSAERKAIVNEEPLYNKEYNTVCKGTSKRLYRSAKRNVPISPNFHTQNFLNLCRLSCEIRQGALTSVAFYLAIHLTKSKGKTQEVEVLSRDIEKDLKLSDKTVTKAINTLEELSYISRTGKSKYLISPRLAFYGDPFEWSIAIEVEDQGQEAITEAIRKIQEEIQEADSKHVFDKPMTELNE